ncbi:protein FAM149B1 isoform X2 [Patella vulgata]|nr:protein FAM149B1 isoform X2 [Patella vulgata]
MHLDIYDVHDPDNNDNIDSHVTNFDELIRGNGILPKHPPTEATAFTNMDADTDNGFEFLREEIFAQDGLYEEIIAIDRAEDNVEPKVKMLPPSRRVGYPPITPNACITNSVMSRLFDDLWKIVIEWIWPVIQKEYPFVTDDVMQQNLDANPSSPNHNNQSPASRQPSFIVNKPILGGRAVTHVGSMFDSQKSFEGILQISSMPMYARDSLDSAAIVDKRPGSSIVTRQRPMSRNFSNPRSMVKRNQQLPPLYSSDRTKEEESSMDALHVHVRKLVPHNTGESISPPPSSAMYQRNNALPPLHMEKSKTYYNRASSAIHVDNKDGRNNFYTNRANLHVERPSTTNEMRSDNLSIANLRRSSTPLGQNRSHLIGNKMFINGSGLQPSSDYPHLQPDILEDHEGSIEEGIQHNNHWPTSNLSNNNRIRRQRPRYLVDAK